MMKVEVENGRSEWDQRHCERSRKGESQKVESRRGESRRGESQKLKIEIEPGNQNEMSGES